MMSGSTIQTMPKTVSTVRAIALHARTTAARAEEPTRRRGSSSSRRQTPKGHVESSRVCLLLLLAWLLDETLGGPLVHRALRAVHRHTR